MDKYQNALIELARCTKQVKDLKDAISYELLQSYKCAEDKLPRDKSDGLISYPDDWEKNWGGKNHWLSNAFSADIGEDFEPKYLSKAEIFEYLRQNCTHAYRAYDLILARKQARKERGIAKRRVTFLANKLLASQR